MGISHFQVALHVHGIKKNFLSISLVAKAGFPVNFIDDRFIVHDLTNGDSIIASRSLYHGLYSLVDVYEKSVFMLANRCILLPSWMITQGMHGYIL